MHSKIIFLISAAFVAAVGCRSNEEKKEENAGKVYSTATRAGDPSNNKVYRRPVGVAFAKDGSLLVADDAGNTVWRVSK